ncbi:MAG: T9SS type A sorting domain-containing protein [Bacteroidetes bacterium]|nr:T9SS type A sorting domain-containing protein [Bacteroidota bacterium]
MKGIFLPFMLLLLAIGAVANNSTLSKLTVVNAEWQKNADGRVLAATANIGNPQSYNDWIATHLMLVENTLRMRDVSSLTIAQQQHRKQLLDELHGYWQAGTFPINDYTNYKTPVFIDAKGTHCAVGYLMQQSGNDALAQAINSKEKFAYVHQITTLGVQEWADEQGFTIDELAWIQPGYPPVTDADDLEGGVNGTVNAMVADAANQIVYIGGSFSQSTKGNTCSNIAAYISGIAGYDWVSVAGGTNGPINAMLLQNGKLYVGGSFSNAGSVAASNVAVYDITSGQWQALGAGLNDEIKALAFYNGELYAGGHHTDMLSKWNGTTWQGINNLLIGGEVRALEVFNNELVVGGNFDIATGAPRKNVIGYDGTNPVIMGFGTATPVNDFAVHEGKLFAACDIVQGTDTCALAVFENSNWTIRLKGSDGLMDAFGGNNIKHIESNGATLLAAGDFWCGSGMTMGNNLMEYSQQTIDTITYNICEPLIWNDSAVHTFTTMGGQLYFGGAFSIMYSASATDTFNHVAALALQSTGIDKVKSAISVQAYPNPTANIVTVKTSGELLTAVEVFDITGRMVLANSSKGSSVMLNVVELPNGIYNIRAHTNKGAGSIRLVKN